MHDHDFWTEMRAEPDADLPRLAYADWLDEQGDGRAEFVRASVRAGRIPHDEPGHLLASAEARYAFLEHGGEWRDRLPDPFRCRFYRGMLRPTLPMHELRRRELWETLPIDGATVFDTELRLAETPGLSLPEAQWLSLPDSPEPLGSVSERERFPEVFPELRGLHLRTAALQDFLTERVPLDDMLPELRQLSTAGRTIRQDEYFAITETELFRTHLRTLRCSSFSSVRGRAEDRSSSLEWADVALLRGSMGFTSERFPQLRNLAPRIGRSHPVSPEHHLKGFRQLRELRCSGAWIPVPEHCWFPETIERLKLTFGRTPEAIGDSLSLLRELCPVLKGFVLKMPEELWEQRDENCLAEHLATATNLKSLTLIGRALAAGQALLTSPDRFSNLRRLELQLWDDSERKHFQTSLTETLSLQIDELDLGRFDGESKADFLRLLQSPVVQNVRVLKIALARDQLGILNRVLRNAPLPRLRGLIIDGDFRNLRLYLGHQPVPPPSALPALIYLSFGSVINTAALKAMQHEYPVIFDPHGSLIDPQPVFDI